MSETIFKTVELLIRTETQPLKFSTTTKLEFINATFEINGGFIIVSTHLEDGSVKSEPFNLNIVKAYKII